MGTGRIHGPVPLSSRAALTRSAPSPFPASTAPVNGVARARQAQRLFGNQAVLRTQATQPQPESKENPPGDRYEQEAEEVADRIVRTTAPKLERKPSHRGPMSVPSVVHEVLRSPGRPLEPDTHAFMAARLGHDFDAIRLHTDPAAARSAAAVGARAYTVGQNLVFGAGEYAPTTEPGRRLLAHELTHSVQQRGMPVSMQCASTSDRDNAGDTPGAEPSERAAEPPLSDAELRLADDYVLGPISRPKGWKDLISSEQFARILRLHSGARHTLVGDPEFQEWLRKGGHATQRPQPESQVTFDANTGRWIVTVNSMPIAAIVVPSKDVAVRVDLTVDDTGRASLRVHGNASVVSLVGPTLQAPRRSSKTQEQLFKEQWEKNRSDQEKSRSPKQRLEEAQRGPLGPLPYYTTKEIRELDAPPEEFQAFDFFAALPAFHIGWQLGELVSGETVSGIPINRTTQAKTIGGELRNAVVAGVIIGTALHGAESLAFPEGGVEGSVVNPARAPEPPVAGTEGNFVVEPKVTPPAEHPPGFAERGVEIHTASEKLPLEATAHAPVGDVEVRSIYGRQSGRANAGQHTIPEGFVGEPGGPLEAESLPAGDTELALESNRYPHARRPRARSVTAAQQLEGIPETPAGKAAREDFTKLRDGYAEALHLAPGGDVHHAIELDVLNRYPGVFDAAELNALDNMRGIPPEFNDQLHLSRIRTDWNRHYNELDAIIAERKLIPGSPEYDATVRNYITDARDEIDWALRHLSSEKRAGHFSANGVATPGAASDNPASAALSSPPSKPAASPTPAPQNVNPKGLQPKVPSEHFSGSAAQQKQLLDYEKHAPPVTKEELAEEVRKATKLGLNPSANAPTPEQIAEEAQKIRKMIEKGTIQPIDPGASGPVEDRVRSALKRRIKEP